MANCSRIRWFGQGDLFTTTQTLLERLLVASVEPCSSLDEQPALVLYISDQPGLLAAAERLALKVELNQASSVNFLRLVRVNDHSLAIGPVVCQADLTGCLDCVDRWLLSRPNPVPAARPTLPTSAARLELEMLGMVAAQQVLNVYYGHLPTVSYLANTVVFDVRSLYREQVSISSLPWCRVCKLAEFFDPARCITPI